MLRSFTRFRFQTLQRAAGAILVPALLAPVPLPLAAQQHDPLGHLVAEALRNNPGFAAEQLAEERTAAGVNEARGGFLPRLDLESRYSRQGGTLNLGDFVNPAYAALNELTGSPRFPTNLDVTLPFAHESRMRLSQPVFNEAVRHNISVARHRNDGQRFHRLAAARQLAAQVQIAYVSLEAARSSAEIYQASLELVAENERVSERLLAAGRATPDVVFRARAERSDVEQRLDEAREQADAAARSLNRLLGRSLDAPIETVPDSALRFALAIEEDAAVVHALAHREELAEVDAGIEAANASVRVANAAFLPSVSLAVDYGFQGNSLSFAGENDFWVGSVVVSWNLFNGGRDAARRAGARAEAERARLLREDLEDRIRLEVRQAYQAAVVARTAIGTAEDRLAAAQRTFELMRRQYEEGLASQVEFLDARTQLTTAELNRELTAHRYAIRYLELERAAALRRMDVRA